MGRVYGEDCCYVTVNTHRSRTNIIYYRELGVGNGWGGGEGVILFQPPLYPPTLAVRGQTTSSELNINCRQSASQPQASLTSASLSTKFNSVSLDIENFSPASIPTQRGLSSTPANLYSLSNGLCSVSPSSITPTSIQLRPASIQD